jgi:hypothetical protein
MIKQDFDVVLQTRDDRKGLQDKIHETGGTMVGYVEDGPGGGNPNVTIEFPDVQSYQAFCAWLFEGAPEIYEYYTVELLAETKAA